MTPAEIRQARTIAGMTRTQLADYLGVRWTTVYRWERGQTTPGGATVRALSQLPKRKP